MDSKDRETVFITGGSGFLGRQVIRDLLAAGYRVRALARSGQAATTVKTLGAEAVAGDLMNIQALQNGMQGCSAVIHCAARVDLWGRWEDFQRDTVLGTEHVIRAARAAGVRRLLHVSTEAVLAGGPAIVQANEQTPYPSRPNGHYPRSKGMAERLVLAANDDGLETVVVRPRLIWGQGDTTLLPQITQAARAGWFWFGGGQHLSSTCHVRNVAHGIMQALQRGRAGQVYFLTDGQPVVFRDFIGRLIRSQGVEPGERNAPLWLADSLAMLGEWLWHILGLKGNPPLIRTSVNLFFREVTIDDTKARKELGYLPVVTIEQGLQELQGAQ